MEVDTCVIRPAEIRAKAGIGKTAFYEQERDELWPQLFSNTGGRAKCCFEHEVDEVLEARAAGANDEEIRAIVRQQVERRRDSFEIRKARAAGASEDEIKALIQQQVERRKERFAALKVA